MKYSDKALPYSVLVSEVVTPFDFSKSVIQSDGHSEIESALKSPSKVV